jgi:hypothetical protein
MKKILILLLATFALYSCGGKNMTVNQVDGYSYLLIKGHSNNELVYIDSDESFLTLGKDTKEYKLDDDNYANKIQIKDGQHKLKILRNGQIIVHRSFFVSSGNSFEVNL